MANYDLSDIYDNWSYTYGGLYSNLYDQDALYSDPQLTYAGIRNASGSGGITLTAVETTGATPVTVTATANAPLGALSASSSTVTKVVVTASALLGALVASATYTSSIPAVPTSGDSGHPHILRPRPNKKPDELPKKIHQVNALARAPFGSFNAHALSTISFSILEDDADVLLLV
jgi:hypothetical protein